MDHQADHRDGTIAASDALAEAGSPGAILLDVRERHEWDRGHSPLATLLPMSELEARFDELPVDRRVLVVCHSGQRSLRVSTALARIGYDAVSIDGGMIAWHAAGGEIVADGSAPARVD